MIQQNKDQGSRAPGTFFRFCTACTVMLSRHHMRFPGENQSSSAYCSAFKRAWGVALAPAPPMGDAAPSGSCGPQVGFSGGMASSQSNLRLREPAPYSGHDHEALSIASPQAAPEVSPDASAAAPEVGKAPPKHHLLRHELTPAAQAAAAAHFGATSAEEAGTAVWSLK